MDPQGLQAGQAVTLNVRLKSVRDRLLDPAWPKLRRGLRPLAWCAVTAGLGLSLGSASAQTDRAPNALPPVTVYAPSPCLACIDWADHLRQHGFTVSMEEKPLAEMPRIKRWLNVPSDLESVHTARVGPYFIEGHVPAPDILELLKEKPKARGLAVPGLPGGAPGRETYNPVCDTACTILDNAGAEPMVRREAFNTLLVGSDGRTSVWARH